MLDLMLRILLVSALATVAGLLFERAFASLRTGTRYAWSFALLATTTLPFLPRVFTSSSTLQLPRVVLPPIELALRGAPARTHDALLVFWIVTALVVACVYGIAYVRLRRARRSWESAVIAGHDVAISDRFGPAICGFTAPRIVVPEWVRAVSAEEQRLIVLHEAEHIAARDHMQLLLMITATTFMPWNPFVWLQARRLRFALEADCDQRVMAAVPDRARYADLLVAVGSRQHGLFIAAALAEHRHSVERRIIMLAQRTARKPRQAAALAVLGIGMIVLACESRASGPQSPNVPVQPAHASVSDAPTFTPFTEMPRLANREDVTQVLAANYPPLLKGAGIAGKTVTWLLIDRSGNVVKTQVKTSSGHEALDQAALKVGAAMKFTPAKNGAEPVNVWVAVPIVFKLE